MDCADYCFCGYCHPNCPRRYVLHRMLNSRIPCPQRQGILVLFSHLIVRIEFSEQFAVGLGKAIVVYFADVDLSSTRVGMAKPFRDNREFSILGIHHTGPGVAADVRRQTEVKSWGFF